MAEFVRGGSGLVATFGSMAVGVPSVVVPCLVDQPLWDRQLHRLGIAATPIPHRRLTPEALVPAVGDALARREQSQRVGRAVGEEQGPRTALDVFTGL